MIRQAICTSFYTELYSGTHNILGGDVVKIALYTEAADLGATTTAYTASGEVSGSGYTAGGITLSGAALRLENGILKLTWSDANFAADLSARGALVYNSSKSNKSIVVLDFGHTKTMNPFIVSF